MRTALTALLAVVLHVLLGWQWVIVAALIGGVMSPRRGWLVGGLGVFAAWAILVGYNFAAAAYETSRMLETLGDMLGGVPGAIILLLTLALAAILGILGGLVGTAVGRLLNLHANVDE